MDVVKHPSRFEVYLIALDPTLGSEMQKTRPCVVVSPDAMNHSIKTIVIAPLTSTIRRYPTRVPVTFQQKKGEVALDQIRVVDKSRLVALKGRLDEKVSRRISAVLVEMFTW